MYIYFGAFKVAKFLTYFSFYSITHLIIRCQFTNEIIFYFSGYVCNNIYNPLASAIALFSMQSNVLFILNFGISHARLWSISLTIESLSVLIIEPGYFLLITSNYYLIHISFENYVYNFLETNFSLHLLIFLLLF